MTTSDESEKPETPGPGRVILLAVVALVIVAGLAVALDEDGGEVGDHTASNIPTTIPGTEARSDLETIEDGVAALYSGDADRAAELFELERTDQFSMHTLTDDGIRQEAAYQAAIGGRLTLDCSEQATRGVFSCRVPYHNALTDAIDYRDSGDTIRAVVEAGVITEFSFPEHSFVLAAFLTYLEDGSASGADNRACLGSRGASRTASCASLMMDNLDEWAAWYEINT